MSVSPAFRRSPAPPRGFVLDGLDLHLLPGGIVGGEQAAAAIAAGTGWPLAGGRLAFTLGSVIWREQSVTWLAALPFAELIDWAEGERVEAVLKTIHRIGGRRPAWGELTPDRPRLMGIINTTPDSFSDGGDRLVPEAAIEAALAAK